MPSSRPNPARNRRALVAMACSTAGAAAILLGGSLPSTLKDPRTLAAPLRAGGP
jgi:hypothetical protein